MTPLTPNQARAWRAILQKTLNRLRRPSASDPTPMSGFLAHPDIPEPVMIQQAARDLALSLEEWGFGAFGLINGARNSVLRAMGKLDNDVPVGEALEDLRTELLTVSDGDALLDGLVSARAILDALADGADEELLRRALRRELGKLAADWRGMA